jgi:hypothetical protein
MNLDVGSGRLRCMFPIHTATSSFLSSISAPVQWQQPIRISRHEGTQGCTLDVAQPPSRDEDLEYVSSCSAAEIEI